MRHFLMRLFGFLLSDILIKSFGLIHNLLMFSWKKGNTRVCKRKKNIAGGLKFLIGTSHDMKGSSKRHKYSDLLDSGDDPRVKEML